MRTIFDLPPPSARLPDLRVHELVRDYPELLALFRDLGIRLSEDGASVLPPDLSGGTGAERLVQCLAWRSRAKS